MRPAASDEGAVHLLALSNKHISFYSPPYIHSSSSGSPGCLCRGLIFKPAAHRPAVAAGVEPSLLLIAELHLQGRAETVI